MALNIFFIELNKNENQIIKINDDLYLDVC